MPYFIEKPEDVFEKVEGELVVEDLAVDVVAAYVISEKVSRAATFKRESLVQKPARRFRCQDGVLRTKDEMSDADKAFLKAKMEKTRAARGKKAE